MPFELSKGIPVFVCKIRNPYTNASTIRARKMNIRYMLE
jgi:hypothetical protein